MGFVFVVYCDIVIAFLLAVVEFSAATSGWTSVVKMLSDGEELTVVDVGAVLTGEGTVGTRSR